jgi:TIR domain
MSNKTSSIFLSYARADNEFALKLAQDLRAAGTSLWVDQFDIEPGQPWDTAVEQALKQSPIMLVIISSASIQSANVLDEISFAIETKKRIVPILHEKCDLPFRIRRLQYVDFTKGYDQGNCALLSCSR